MRARPSLYAFVTIQNQVTTAILVRIQASACIFAGPTSSGDTSMVVTGPSLDEANHAR